LNALSNGKSPSPRAKGDQSQRLTVVIPNAALRADGGHSHDAPAFRIADNKLAENIPNGPTGYSRSGSKTARSSASISA
jgi:hypothetical protein